MAPKLLDAVHHPEVGLEVEPEIFFAVDGDRREPLREDVLAALRKGHLGPGLPLGDGAADAHRARLGPQDLTAEAHVRADPRAEREAVIAPPARVPRARPAR